VGDDWEVIHNDEAEEARQAHEREAQEAVAQSAASIAAEKFLGSEGAGGEGTPKQMTEDKVQLISFAKLKIELRAPRLGN
jgi:hypothetical protein